MNSINALENFRNLYGLTYDELSSYLNYSPVQFKKIIRDNSVLPKHLSDDLELLQSDLREARNFLETYSDHKFTFIDLFAGIGGMRLGFEKAGGKCIFTSEWDKFPAMMYEKNFGDRPSGDITKISVEDIPKHDILVGGFPCQPFSLAGVSKKNSMGRSHGFECKTQGTLFFDVARIINHHRPKMFLLENVKNLKSHDGGNTFKVIMETLRDDLGYRVSEKVIDGGLMVPQHRERIYIVGTLDDEDFNFPEIKRLNRTIEEILQPDEEVESKYTLSDGLWKSLKNHAEKHKAKGNGFGYGLIEKTGRARTLSARYYKDGAEILIAQRNKNPRRLTPKECARLMGFPDRFKINLSDNRAYKCFGNSVVVPIIQKLALAMAETSIIKEISKSKKTNVRYLS